MRKITNRFTLVALLLTLFCMTGCVNVKKLQQIRILDAKLESVSPESLRQYVVTGSVTVANPAAEVSVSEISGVLEHNGKVIGSIAVDPVTLTAKSEQTYTLRADAKVADGIGIFELAKYMDKAVLKQCVVDLKADVRVRNGKVRTVELEDIPLNELLELIR
jgi:hypothetical protein